MKITTRWFYRLLFPAIAAWGLILVSCVMVDRTVIAPPRIAGATFVGQSECTTCHVDKRGQVSLAHSHPILTGQVTCADCHDPHSGDAIKGGGINLATANETCTKCHTAQKGPFVFAHNAIREGCTTCHNPHGSVNDKMLVARDDNLCLRCHLEVAGKGQIIVGGEDHASRLQRGTCWSAGCHEAPHGSNANAHFRF
jgi:DmsE family decaheme c-type cytochrome